MKCTTIASRINQLLLSATHLPSHRLSFENMVIYAQYAELRIYFRQLAVF